MNILNFLEMVIVMMNQIKYIVPLMVVTAVIHQLLQHFVQTVNVYLEMPGMKSVIHWLEMVIAMMKPTMFTAIMTALIAVDLL